MQVEVAVKAEQHLLHLNLNLSLNLRMCQGEGVSTAGSSDTGMILAALELCVSKSLR